jgi:hypothetical protein
MGRREASYDLRRHAALALSSTGSLTATLEVPTPRADRRAFSTLSTNNEIIGFGGQTELSEFVQYFESEISRPP